MITGDVIFDLPFYNAKGILTGGDIYGPRYRIAKLTVEHEPVEEGGETTSENFFEVCIWHASTCYEGKYFRLMQREGKLCLHG